MQHPVNILIVDEVALYRKVLANCLQRSGYQVAGACGHNQQEIEAVISKDFPDIAIISFKTTQRSSLYTFEWMKEYFSDIKQVMTTLYPSGCANREAKRLNVHGVIVTSFDGEEEIKTLLRSLHP